MIQARVGKMFLAVLISGGITLGSLKTAAGQSQKSSPGLQPPIHKTSRPDNAGGQAPGKGEAKGGPVVPGQTTSGPSSHVVLEPGQVPMIFFDTPTFDAGRIKAGQDVVHDFWFTNKGNGPLEIIDVRPSCGCTKAGEHDRIVPAGKTGKIPIKVATAGMMGVLTKTIAIQTNAPANSANVVLTVKAEIWQPVSVTPPAASFGRLTSDMTDVGAYERRLTITNNVPNVQATLSDVKCNNPAFTAEVVVLEKGQKFELVVKAKQPLDFGSLQGSIELSTGVPDLPKLTIPAQAYVANDVDVTPNKLSIPVERREPMARQLYVRNNTSKPITVSDLQVSNPKLKVSMNETQPGVAYLVNIQIPVDFVVSSKGDQIKLKTTNPRIPELIVPVVNYSLAAEKLTRNKVVLDPNFPNANKSVNFKEGEDKSTLRPSVPPVSPPPPAPGAGSEKPH